MIRNIKLAAVLAAFCAALCAQGAERPVLQFRIEGRHTESDEAWAKTFGLFRKCPGLCDEVWFGTGFGMPTLEINRQRSHLFSVTFSVPTCILGRKLQKEKKIPNINLAALNMFSTAKDWTADSIANLDGKDAIKKVGDYVGAFSALGRSSIEKAANNVMRTELLKALANAFNMQVETDSDGKARFNRAFLRNLERNPNLSARTACP